MANTTIYPYGTDGQLPSSIGIINDTTTGGADKALSAEQGKKIGKFGAEAIAEADKIPASFSSAPITIEDLFVFMAKEGK